MTEKSEAPVDERAVTMRIAERPHAQVLIIGGGINGIATFRDLALQGVDVVLVERDDFASGASSASSHMIHGGIRYLENGEFRLVRESVAERNGLLKIAPHYVKPLRTTIPIFSTFSGIVSAPARFLTHKAGKPKERGAFLIKTGLLFYDSFSRDGGNVPRHRVQGRRASLQQLPALNPGLKYTATYYDASVHDPERLAVDLLLDGLAAGLHARAANYLEAVGTAKGGVLVRDRLSGRQFVVTADVVVNASGPWTDLTNRALGSVTSYMGGTKGSHIVLDCPELLAACRGREIFFENRDGRIVLVYPLKGRVLVGTTDIDTDMATSPVCTEEEVDYFIELIAHVFPGVTVERSQIVFRFSGVRPLPKHEDTQPGFVSRDYRIMPGIVPGTEAVPLLSLVGGKLTTFRALAEHLSDQVLELLGLARTVETAGLAIGGGRGFPSDDRARSAWIARNGGTLSPDRVGQLLERYGTRARPLIEAVSTAPESPLATVDSHSDIELAYLARSEFVVHLIDLLLRRTSLAFVGALSADAVEEIAQIAGDAIGWSPARRRQEVNSAVAELRERHGVQLVASAGARRSRTESAQTASAP